MVSYFCFIVFCNCIRVNNPSCELGSNEIKMVIAKFVCAEWMLKDIFLNKLKPELPCRAALLFLNSTLREKFTSQSIH